jgi:hypothetical protein
MGDQACRPCRIITIVLPDSPLQPLFAVACHQWAGRQGQRAWSINGRREIQVDDRFSISLPRYN